MHRQIHHLNVKNTNLKMASATRIARIWAVNMADPVIFFNSILIEMYALNQIKLTKPFKFFKIWLNKSSFSFYLYSILYWKRCEKYRLRWNFTGKQNMFEVTSICLFYKFSVLRTIVEVDTSMRNWYFLAKRKICIRAFRLRETSKRDVDFLYF